MTLYDLWLSLVQMLLGTFTFFKDHPTVPGLIILILRQNSIRKVINKQLPRKFRDTVDIDILEIKGDIKLIKTHLGVIGEWQSNGQQNGLKRHPLSFNKLFTYLHKVIPLGNRLRRKNMLTSILKANLSKKLISALVSIGVVSLNNKFNLGIDENVAFGILGLSAAHITLQTIIDSAKANALKTISSGTSNIKWDNITYKDARTAVKVIHDGVNAIFKDFEKNDGSQAYLDAVQAYSQLEPIIDAAKKPEPLPEVTESQVSA